jgi:histidinol-phosphate/aromatic aminotransferase/cobyric acid decarboxylase-like protein
MVAFAQKKGLILRPESTLYGSNGWFRVSIGTKEENRMFVEAVKEFFSK